MMGLRPSTAGIYGKLNWFRDVTHENWVTLPQYFRKRLPRLGRVASITKPVADSLMPLRGIMSIPRTGASPPKSSATSILRLVTINHLFARLIDWGPTNHPIEANPDWKTADSAAKFCNRITTNPSSSGAVSICRTSRVCPAEVLRFASLRMLSFHRTKQIL